MGVDQTSFKGAKIDTIDPKGDTANTVFSVNEISLESVKLRVTATAAKAAIFFVNHRLRD